MENLQKSHTGFYEEIVCTARLAHTCDSKHRNFGSLLAHAGPIRRGARSSLHLCLILLLPLFQWSNPVADPRAADSEPRTLTLQAPFFGFVFSTSSELSITMSKSLGIHRTDPDSVYQQYASAGPTTGMARCVKCATRTIRDSEYADTKIQDVIYRHGWSSSPLGFEQPIAVV